jgi:hypothetical protein
VGPRFRRLVILSRLAANEQPARRTGSGDERISRTTHGNVRSPTNRSCQQRVAHTNPRRSLSPRRRVERRSKDSASGALLSRSASASWNPAARRSENGPSLSRRVPVSTILGLPLARLRVPSPATPSHLPGGEFIAGQPSLVGCRAAVVIAGRGGSLDEFVHCVGDGLPVDSCVDLGWRRNLSA